MFATSRALQAALFSLVLVGMAQVSIAHAQDDDRFLTFAARLTIVAPTELDLIGKCDGNGCPEDDTTTRDRNATVNLGGELLFRLSEAFRLGVSLSVQLNKLELEGKGLEQDSTFGRFIRAPLIAEGRIPLSQRLALPIRAFAGPALFAATDDLDDVLDELHDRCDDVPGCDSAGPPGIGVTLGAGIGLLVDVGPVSLRADLLVGWDWVRLMTIHNDDADVKSSLSMSGLMVAPSFALEI